jgi:hypothetical protein
MREAALFAWPRRALTLAASTLVAASTVLYTGARTSTVGELRFISRHCPLAGCSQAVGWAEGDALAASKLPRRGLSPETRASEKPVTSVARTGDR